jgi:hypothetical protein
MGLAAMPEAARAKSQNNIVNGNRAERTMQDLHSKRALSRAPLVANFTAKDN